MATEGKKGEQMIVEKSGDKKRYFFFYPGDWMRDIELQACSLQAQGAWILLLCYMHESSEYGCLYANNKPLKENGIQNLLHLGTDEETFKSIMEELTSNGVMRRDSETGAYFSKRMVRDKNYYQPKVQVKQESVPVVNLKIIENVINYLNDKAEKKYTTKNPEYINIINAQIIAGFTEKDFKKVINIKCRQWKGTEKFDGNLRPETLFGVKFESYVNEKSNSMEDHMKKTQDAPYKKINPYNEMNK